MVLIWGTVRGCGQIEVGFGIPDLGGLDIQDLLGWLAVDPGCWLGAQMGLLTQDTYTLTILLNRHQLGHAFFKR